MSLSSHRESGLWKQLTRNMSTLEKVYNFLGENVSMHLPHIHVIPGCDTTSFFYGVGKVKLLKKIIKHQDSLDLLSSLGESKELNVQNVEDVIVSVQTVMYSGRKDELYVDTRVRLYKDMKIKSSQSLLPDPDWMQQAIRRVHFQVNYWLRFGEKSVQTISLEANGWTIDIAQSLVEPVWFTGEFLLLLNWISPIRSL